MNIFLILLSSIMCYFFTKKIYRRLIVNYPNYASEYSQYINALAIIVNFLLQFKFLNKLNTVNFFMYGTFKQLLVPICIMSIIVISSCLAISSAVDILTYELPDELNLLVGISIIPIAFFLYSGLSILTGIAIFIIYFLLAIFTNSFGMGDVKLSLAIGMGLKFSLLFKFIFFAFLFASIFSILKIATKKANLKSEIAFGPYIVLSFILLF